MEKKTVKRNTRTRQAIHDAFVEMVCSNRPEEMNIKLLTEKAGIHRKTFYLHYSCIEALFEDELNRLVDGYAKEVDKLSIPFNYYDLTKIFFEFYTQNEFRELLYCNPQYHQFSNQLMLISMEHNRSISNPYADYSPKMQNIINAFVTNASTFAFRQWVADGKVVPMNEVIHVVSSLLENGVNSIIKSKLSTKS